MQKVETETGSVPLGVYAGLLTLLRTDSQTYLPPFFRAVEKGHISLQKGVDFLTEIDGKGADGVQRTLARYNRAA